MKLKHLFLPLLLLGISSTILASSALFAQENTILMFAVPDWMESNIEDDVFDEFEAAHPGVNVVLNPISSDVFYPTPPEFNIEDHLDRTGDLASAGDVMLVTNYNMTPAAIRAGYFLDLTPLISSDFELDTNDFFPAMWESFQRDQGMWGLPISGSFNIFIYRKSAFDEAGVPYPTQDWTFADFTDAVRTLTQYDENGEVVMPGFISFGTNYLIRSFLEQGFEDASAFPSQPYITSPELIEMLGEWRALEEEGVFGGLDSESRIDYNQIPLTVQPPFNLMYTTAPDTEDFGGVLLPGGVAGMDINGVALSAGTEQPELAYELAKYVTSNTEMVTMLFGLSPARRSMVDAVSDSNFAGDLSPEVQTLIDDARNGALPVGEMGFYPYIDFALNHMREDDTLDATTALETMEEQAIQDMQVAAERSTTTVISVATPEPTPVLGANEIALRFNLNTFTTSLSNEDDWDQFIADFATEDPQVGYVDFSMSYDDFTGLAEENDCFYLPYNALSSSNLTYVLPIDPFLSADFDFDPNDMPPGVMAQVQHNGLTYGLPMNIQPQVLWYDSEQFDAAGILPPENGWTVAEFEDALRLLEANGDGEIAPFASYGSNYITMLIASYGGVPVDNTSNPPVIDFTNPANVEAIRQVLDLARAGYLSYSELGSITPVQSFSTLDGVAIYDDVVSSYSFDPQFMSGSPDNVYRLTSYPRGTQYTPVRYGIGAAFISSTAQNPDACYRFLSALSQRPELLGGMPARRSAIDNPELIASQPETAINFYRNYFDTLYSPDTVVLSGNFGSGDQFAGSFILNMWLFQAFDAYVLEDADLETALQQAQTLGESYLACTAEIAPLDPSLQSSDEAQTDYFREYARCAVLVDPEMEPFFGGLLDEESSGNG